MHLTLDTFLKHQTGRTFSAIANDPRYNAQDLIHLLNQRLGMMLYLQKYPGIPPVGTIARELERNPLFTPHLSISRYRFMVGAMIGLIMEGNGGKRTGEKVSVTRFSDYFRVAERYEVTQAGSDLLETWLDAFPMV